MSATSRWLVRGDDRDTPNLHGPGYGGFNYAAICESKYPSGPPLHVKKGLCFTLNCAWLQTRATGLPYPQWRFRRLETNFERYAGMHGQLAALKGQARAAMQVEMFKSFELNRFEANEYGNSGDLATFDAEEQNPWEEFRVTRGDMWGALATWIADSAVRQKYSGPAQLAALILEVYAKGNGVGHSISIDMRHLKTQVRIFDMNEGEYEVSLGELANFFAAFEKDNEASKTPTERIEVHPFE
jgi:hypothetical protein